MVQGREVGEEQLLVKEKKKRFRLEALTRTIVNHRCSNLFTEEELNPVSSSLFYVIPVHNLGA